MSSIAGGGPIVHRRRAQFGTVPKSLIQDPNLSDSAVRLYALLDEMGNGDDDAPYPGREWIADRLGWSEKKVTRAGNELVRAGYLEKRQRGQGRSNVYYVSDRPRTRTNLEGTKSTFLEGTKSTFLEGTKPYPHNQNQDNHNQEKGSGEPEPPSPIEPASQAHIDAVRLADLLAQKVSDASETDYKKPSRTSVNGIEKLIRIDGIAAERVERCILWIFDNPAGEFWRSNIMSGRKLREHFPRLQIEARKKPKGTRAEKSDAAIADLLNLTQTPPERKELGP